MEIFTLNVGQGQFVVVTGDSEAIIIDTYVPQDLSKQEAVFMRKALPEILKGRKLVGLIVTGFDDDHFCELGLNLVLFTYFPKWCMYPKYKKDTTNARCCFGIIDKLSSMTRIPVEITRLDTRFFNDLSKDFSFEIFSPHVDDMTSSNNCSLVCKVVEKKSGSSYLITGDTEGPRWESIARYFKSSLKADVLDAPHHGSDKGITDGAMGHIKPHTVLISAGIGNQWGHPEAGAMRIYQRHSTKQWQTNAGPGGQTLHTTIVGSTLLTRTITTVARTF